MISDWRPVPGWADYEVSIRGEIRRIRTQYGNPINKRMHPVLQFGRTKVCLCSGNRHHSYGIGRLVWRAFVGEIPDGMVIIHRDGCKYNNALDNLQLISRSKMVPPTNLSRKPVIKMSANGEILAIYPSAKEAAADNYMSKASIRTRCKGINKRPDPDGCIYRYDK